MKLKNWFEKHQMKLIDFFTKFDKDGSMTVSRDEFKSGLIVKIIIKYFKLGIIFSKKK